MYKPRMVHVRTYHPPIHFIAPTTIPVLSPVLFMPSLYYTSYNSKSFTSLLPFLAHFVQHSLGNRWLKREVFTSSQCLDNSSSLARSVNSRGNSQLGRRMRITTDFIRKSDDPEAQLHHHRRRGLHCRQARMCLSLGQD